MRIIEEINDSASDIHLFVTGQVTDYNVINFGTIHKKYPHRYKLSLFKPNLKRLLNNFEENTGPFKGNKVEVELWTSRGKQSNGWELLIVCEWTKAPIQN